jgi:hypothetical protein
LSCTGLESASKCLGTGQLFFERKGEEKNFVGVLPNLDYNFP